MFKINNRKLVLITLAVIAIPVIGTVLDAYENTVIELEDKYAPKKD